MTAVFGSKGGTFKEATGMWASKDGLWQPVPLGESAPPISSGAYDKWTLADVAATAPVPFLGTAWPEAGWTAGWEGNDLIINSPGSADITFIGPMWWSVFYIPDWNLPGPHVHASNPADATHLTFRWSHTITPDYPTSSYLDCYHAFSWVEDLSANMTPPGGFTFLEKIDNTWTFPLSIAEDIFPLTAFGMVLPPPAVFPIGYWIYFVIGSNNAVVAPNTFRFIGTENEWGFSNTAAARESSIKPFTYSDRFLQKYDQLMTVDLGTLPPEAAQEVEKLRAIDPIYKMFQLPGA